MRTAVTTTFAGGEAQVTGYAALPANAWKTLTVTLDTTDDGFTIRLIVGPILLFVDWITTPKGMIRGAAEQQAVNEATRQLTLYQFKTCPFCMKVRRAGKRLSLNIEKRDAQHNADARQELLQATGKTQVPCLRIVGADGSVRWMQDSGAIIQYLQERFASQYSVK